MGTNQVAFIILPSGEKGMKVVRVLAGRSIRVYASRSGDPAVDRLACRLYLERVRANGMGPCFGSVEELENMRAARVALQVEHEAEARSFAQPAPKCGRCRGTGRMAYNHGEDVDICDCILEAEMARGAK